MALRALVTGGAGFIGSHLVDRLLCDGHEVTVADNLARGSTRNLHAALTSGRCELVECDVADRRSSAVLASTRPDTVFHLAAQIDVRSSVADPVEDARINIEGTVAVLEAARRAGARVVFASSVAIYGVSPMLPVTEQTPPAPFSPYAVSKLAGELYVQQFGRLYGLPGAVLRFGNVYGPRQDCRGEAGVVAIFTDAMLTGRPTRVFGDGTNIRDYIYVADVVDALVRASTGAADGMRCNIGTGVAVTDLALHSAVADAAGVRDEPEFAPARPGDLPAMTLDSTTAREHLGWVPCTTLDDGLARTVAWARQQLGHRAGHSVG